MSGVLNGTGSFTKIGTGTLTLSGAHTYSGGTTISAGTVSINNASESAFGTGSVTVASDATLMGSGSFTGALTLGWGDLRCARRWRCRCADVGRHVAHHIPRRLCVYRRQHVRPFRLRLPQRRIRNLRLSCAHPGLTWDTSGLCTMGELGIIGSAIPEPSTYAAIDRRGVPWASARGVGVQSAAPARDFYSGASIERDEPVFNIATASDHPVTK